jgi:putative pyrroloquinoline-quinone binding quinoprotein
MTDDFTTRLRVQLHDAALREEQRSAVARAAATARTRPSLAFGSFAAALAVGLVLALGLWMVSSPPNETTTPDAGPRVVANVALADSLGRSSRVAFGSVWLSEPNSGQIVRVDPRTRRVIARIPVGSEVNLDAADGSIWAIPSGSAVTASPLMRIDPRTNRIVARIPMRVPGGPPFTGGFIVAGRHVWVVGATSLLSIDPTRNVAVRERDLGGSYQITNAFLHDGELWLTRGDRTITRLDAANGRRLGRLPWLAPQDGFVFPYAGRLVKVSPRSVALADPATGRPLWRTRLGTQVNGADVAGGRVYVEGRNGSTARDALWALDPRTGRVTGTLTVPVFGVISSASVGRDLWLFSAAGRTVVVAP